MGQHLGKVGSGQAMDHRDIEALRWGSIIGKVGSGQAMDHRDLEALSGVASTKGWVWSGDGSSRS